jgi:hypothetical protein
MLLLLFSQGIAGAITGTMAVTDAPDIVSIIGTGPAVVVVPAGPYLAPSRYDYGWYNGRPSR